MRDGKIDIDRQTYNDKNFVRMYARDSKLQPAEAALLERLRADLPHLDMLDLGVGAGRTAFHFAPVARSYLGIDYSAAMIEECRRQMPNVRFEVGDARAMDFAADESFDLVLFSYNGVDHLTETERGQFLREAMRILRPGGLLAFSSHNANYIPKIIALNRFRIQRSLRETLRSLKWSAIFRLHNPWIGFRPPPQAGRFFDGLHGFKSAGVYYIRPDLQIAALRRAGITDICCVGNDESDIVSADPDLIRNWTYPWVYYFCRRPRDRN
jgi:SAM-dependent methyltransferase